MNVADVVPNGMDLDGFFKSPDKPTPAVIPVKAGNIIAKTIKKLSEFRKSAFSKLKSDAAEYSVFPKKNHTSEANSIITTK